MDKMRHIALAGAFGVFSAVVAMVVQIVALALMGTAVAAETLLSAAVSGVCVFVVSFLTVLIIWPRIGFDPFESHQHHPT